MRFGRFVRAQVAGLEACATRAASLCLHEVAGRRWVPESLRLVTRRLFDGAAGSAVAADAAGVVVSRALVERSAARGASALARTAGEAGRVAAAIAAREVLRGVGRASAAGFVVDAAIGGVVAARAYRRGECTAREAWGHVAEEGITGGLACGAGVALAVGAVALSGGLGVVTVFAIGAAGATGAKAGLQRIVRRRREEAVRAV